MRCSFQHRDPDNPEGQGGDDGAEKGPDALQANAGKDGGAAKANRSRQRQDNRPHRAAYRLPQLSMMD